MRAFRIALVSMAGLSLAGGSLLVGVTAAGGATEPPPIIVHSPPSKSLAAGSSFTFRASARDAELALWYVSTDGGASWSPATGPTSTTTTKGVLKTSYVFGPFEASESGWELRAVFVNDPTGVPSGIQSTATAPAVITLKGHAAH